MIEYTEFFFNCNEPFVSDLETIIEEVRENYVMARGFAPGLGRIEPTVMGRQEAKGWYVYAGQRSIGTSWEGKPFHWNELSKSQVKAEALDRRRKMIAERDAFRADMARLKAAFAAAAGFLGGDVEIASGDIVGEDVRVRLKNGAALLVGNGGCRYGETYRLRGQTETHLWRERLEPTADGSAHEIMDANGETLSRHAVEGDAQRAFLAASGSSRMLPLSGISRMKTVKLTDGSTIRAKGPSDARSRLKHRGLTAEEAERLCPTGGVAAS